MKSIGWLLTLATLVAISSSATSHAAMHAKKHAVLAVHAQAAVNGATCSDPSKCVGSCPRKGAASTASNAAATPHQKMSQADCPFSDPSKCPASCRPSGAVTTVVNTRH